MPREFTEEEQFYGRLKLLVRFIATDYVELSHDKVAIQIEEYRRMARKLNDEIRLVETPEVQLPMVDPNEYF